MFDKIKSYFNRSLLTQEEASPVIAGVRDYYSSFPSNGLTPVKLARILRDAAEGDVLAYLELAEEMEDVRLGRKDMR